MKPRSPQYPVDRYLVESSKKVEMVNIINDDIWNIEPALKPEDEIILRKLHDMLQSTADDLKVLSGELSKSHEPGIQIKSQPTPLDEKFNEKVHIEEIVNAKFHGYKIVDKPLSFLPESKINKNRVNEMLASKTLTPKTVSVSVQVNSNKPISEKNLQTSRPKNSNTKNDSNEIEQKIEQPRKKTNAISYDEFTYTSNKKDLKSPKKRLQIQNMPTISIRSELQEQKVLHLDILPESREKRAEHTQRKNVGVVEIQHERPRNPNIIKPQSTLHFNINKSRNKPIRKISKISTCESSESTNNVSSDTKHKSNLMKQFEVAIKMSPKMDKKQSDIKDKKSISSKSVKSLNLENWRKKLNTVYGQSSNLKSRSTSKQIKISPKKNVAATKPKQNIKQTNTTEYIPYKKLTLGGVRVSDIEKEISSIPNTMDLELSPILDKILSSRENSARNAHPNTSPKVLTTSDENLLHEVLDIEKTVSDTLSKPLKVNLNEQKEVKTSGNIENTDDKDNSYDDDFEEEKSDITITISKSKHSDSEKSSNSLADLDQDKSNHDGANNQTNSRIIQNTTFTKVSNLSFKNSVDIFEFVHSVDTHDTGTQSNSSSKISLKETQTSPTSDKLTVKSTQNARCSTFDPLSEVEKLFKFEKEFIKKIIIDEYGEFIEKSIAKPSSSKDKEDVKNNVAASQKNTQTSPAHVKCVMTSPARTKTRTTSPLCLSLKVDRHTSPVIVSNGEDHINIDLGNDSDDLGISINLSSPRFSLRLPQNSREVISNLDICSRTPSKVDDANETKIPIKSKSFRKYAVSSSSSVDADNYSSEISSIGEIKLKRKMKKNRVTSDSECSSSSVVSKQSSDVISGDILPLRSEGEMSLGQTSKFNR